MTAPDWLTLLGLVLLTIGIVGVFGPWWAALIDGTILLLAGIGGWLSGRKAAVTEEQAVGDEPA